jgi:hypothetical protein
MSHAFRPADWSNHFHLEVERYFVWFRNLGPNQVEPIAREQYKTFSNSNIITKKQKKSLNYDSLTEELVVR